MSLLATASQRWWGGSSLNYDFGATPGSGAPGLRGPAVERPGVQWQRPQIPAADRFLEGPLMVFSLGASRYVLFPTVQVHALVGYQQQDASVSGAGDSTGLLDARGHDRSLAVGLYRGLERRVPVDGIRRAGGCRSSRITLTPREDQTRILQATLLNRAITVYGFSPQVASIPTRSANPTRNCTTTNVTVVEMRWVRQF